ncbi:hypothetical protein IPL68_02135 [Candidatus Saccharibacteria bacterium]|nr:MAG: hypothetical protein IPL68_02135 [Candidatus Saccharibacteria bacterium]
MKKYEERGIGNNDLLSSFFVLRSSFTFASKDAKERLSPHPAHRHHVPPTW